VTVATAVELTEGHWKGVGGLRLWQALGWSVYFSLPFQRRYLLCL